MQASSTSQMIISALPPEAASIETSVFPSDFLVAPVTFVFNLNLNPCF